MATHHCFIGAPLPFQALEEEEDKNSKPPQEYNEFISTLPRHDEAPARRYQGFWCLQRTLPGMIATQQHFMPRPSDMFIASYPKSGTTWVKALTFALMTRTQYKLAQNPLQSLHPHDCVPFLEGTYGAGLGPKLASLPSPRLLSSHMFYPLLPESITRLSCKIIYVCRDPKDVLVSAFHFSKKSVDDGERQLEFIDFFESFCEGVMPYGPIWDHILGYWHESLRRPNDVSFLNYEEMLKDPTSNVKQLAEFVECPFSEKEDEEGVIEEVIKLCSFDTLKNLDANKSGSQGFLKFPKCAYFRKGVAGDWRNHLSPEMAQRLDGIIQEKFRGSGLTIRHNGSIGGDPRGDHGHVSLVPN